MNNEDKKNNKIIITIIVATVLVWFLMGLLTIFKNYYYSTKPANYYNNTTNTNNTSNYNSYNSYTNTTSTNNYTNNSYNTSTRYEPKLSTHTCYVCNKESSSCQKIGSYWYCPSCSKLMHKAGY